jgi:hypothetical protein
VVDLNLDQSHPDAMPGDTVMVKRAKGVRLVCIRASSGWVSFSRFYCGNKKGMGASEFSSGFMKNSCTTRFVAEETEI